MSTSTNAAGGGIGLGGLVFVVLLVLKLTKLAAISWFWVFFPLWVGVAAVFAISGALLVVAGLIWLIAHLVEVVGDARKARRFNKQLR